MSVTRPLRTKHSHGIKLLLIEENTSAKHSQKNELPALMAKFDIQLKVRV